MSEKEMVQLTKEEVGIIEFYRRLPKEKQTVFLEFLTGLKKLCATIDV